MYVPIGYPGLGGPVALSGTEPADEDLPSRAEVKKGYQYYLALAPQKFPSRDMTPQEAVEWGRSALDNYASSKGKSRNAHYLAARDFVASSNGGKGFNTSDSRYAEYSMALGEITGAAGSEYYQVAVELGVVTYDTIQDGKISESDAVKIGQATGAVVGGVVAQAFGVPAPIGALAGGYIGGGAAAIVYNVFGGEDLADKADRQAAQARAEVERFRSNAVYACRGLEATYWKAVDDFYKKFAIGWTKAEQNINWRFKLRWFDPNPELAFRYTWDKATGRATDQKRTDTYGIEHTCGTQLVVHSQGEERIRTCKYKCPFIYGCPYPELGPGAVPGKIVQEALTDDSQRVSQAFAARGVLWLPSSMRLSCESYISPVPDTNLATNYQQRDQYMRGVQTELTNLARRVYVFERARAYLQADLLRTVTVVSAEKDMYMKRAQYLSDGWQKGSYESAITTSRSLSKILNTTVLAGGVSLAAYGLWRAVK